VLQGAVAHVEGVEVGFALGSSGDHDWHRATGDYLVEIGFRLGRPDAFLSVKKFQFQCRDNLQSFGLNTNEKAVKYMISIT
jgi:hypothetical protein